eukprot:scaffold12294_cov105-Skeletonema_dohrnii-CCMP3373.AAC.1
MQARATDFRPWIAEQGAKGNWINEVNGLVMGLKRSSKSGQESERKPPLYHKAKRYVDVG